MFVELRFCHLCFVLMILGFAHRASAEIDPDAEYKSIPIFAGWDTREPPGLEDLKITDAAAYKEAKTALSTRKQNYNSARSIVLGILANNPSEEVDATTRDRTFNTWFEQIVFAEMTQSDRESLLEIPKLREKFFLDYFERPAKVTPPEVRERLLNMTRTRMLAIVGDTYHPAVRFNAMLIIGRLNAKEGITIGSADEKSPPIPWSDPTKALGDLFKAFRDPATIEEVRIAAMIGLLRHAKMDGQRSADRKNMKPDVRNAIITEMVNLLKADPPANRSLQGHEWMQRRAMDVIGGFRDRGPGGIGALELERIMADDLLLPSYRVTAAAAYGKLVFPPDEATPAIRVRRLGQLATSVCNAELDRLDGQIKDHEALIAKKLGLGKDPDDPELPGAVAKIRNSSPLDPFKVTSSRRLLKHYIYTIDKSVGVDERSGFRKYALADPDKAYTASVHAAMVRLLNATDKPKDQTRALSAEDLMTQIATNVAALDKLVADAKPEVPDGPAPPAVSDPGAPTVSDPGAPTVSDPGAPVVPPPAP